MACRTAQNKINTGAQNIGLCEIPLCALKINLPMPISIRSGITEVAAEARLIIRLPDIA